jgi:hypothetical protein
MAQLVIVGAGPIGTWAAEAAVKDGVVDSIRAVVDPDEKARRELVAATGAPGYASTVQLPHAADGDVALVAFASSAERVAPEVIRLVSAGYDVVTTCEGLAWAPRHLWDALHTSARSDARTIIVTGTTPGFITDRIPLALATASRNVTRVTVRRHMDTSTLRPSLVTKSGRGLTTDEFHAQLRAGRVGVAGIEASAKIIARGLEWSHKDVVSTVEPIVEDGQIIGAHHLTKLSAGSDRSILIEVKMAWQLALPTDTIDIEGSPPINVSFAGGYPTDEGTAAQVVGAIRRCATLRPGFYRPTDLPLRFGVEW